MNELHPETGLHYVHVVPYGRDMDEIAARYEDLRPWMSVWRFSDREKMHDMMVSAPASAFFVCWYQSNPGPKAVRRAKITTVYYEAIGRREVMLPEHVAVLDDFVGYAKNYDGVFAHTPWMSLALKQHTGIPSFFLPLGLSVAALGDPEDRCERSGIAYYGSPAGKRPSTIQRLQQFLPELSILQGYYGRELVAELAKVSAVLYVAHTDVASFSTPRIWHAVAARTPLIAEVADCWPLVPWTHFIPLPRTTAVNASLVAEELRWALENTNLPAMAGRAWNACCALTAEVCVEDFLIPASSNILGVP